MKKVILLIAIAVFAVLGAAAQTHNSVKVEEVELYRLLEIAEIAGMIDRLPGARPLPLSVVKKALRQIEESRDELSELQRGVLADYIERFVEDPDEPFLRDAELRYEDDVFPVSWRFYFESDAHVDMADTAQSGIHNIVGGIFGGNLGDAVSYGFDITGQINKVNIDDNAPYPYAWEPYTYTKVWDGGARYLSSPSPQYLMPNEIALGWSLNPEIAMSFWDNKVDLRFGRMRRDWGFGEGNLFLDEQARPFMGFEGSLTPWKWLTFNFVWGTLEYGPTFRNSPYATGNYYETGVVGAKTNYTIGTREISTIQQNMLSLFLVEAQPTKWLYVGLWDSVIYLKRFELGYLFPFMSKLLSQNNTGDYDNLLFGATLALSWPGVGRLYGSLLLDEWNPTIALNSLRNQTAIQGGIKATIPMDLWNLVTFQYTKIEPFTYTHYAVSGSPWYYDPASPLEMETGYLNNGESLGSYLEPNSDEFILSIDLQPARGWTAGFKYRLIRHGDPATVPGSSYDTWGTIADGGPDGDPEGAYIASGTKDFLKDGVYEWFHIFSLGGSVDLRNFFAPATLGLQYSFVYEYNSDYATNANFNPVAGSQQFRHLIGLNLKIYPK